MASPTMKLLATGMLIAAFFLVSAPATAQEDAPDDNVSIARLFSNNSPLVVTIEAPLTTLMNDRPQEDYLDGKFSFTENDGTKQTFDLKLRARGKYRRQKEHCDFAPIRLNFRKKQVVDTEFAGQDKLKLVTHCRTDNSSFEQLVLREFLAYRFLNVLTSKSYGVRLLQINYVDTEGAKPMTKLGFIIEDNDDVAERNGMIPVRIGNISSYDLDRRQENFVNVFQYLIGNTEYSLFRAEPGEDCCHNSDLMSATGRPPYTPLAYDFDFAGIVNTPYAQPNPRFNLRSVRQRLYRGQCKNNELLPDTVQRFLDEKDAIYGVVEELELFNSRSKRDVTGYLNQFYDHISESKSVDARFVGKCDDLS